MKRVTVWIDCKDDEVELVCKRLEKLLNQARLRYRVVDICELLGVDGGR